MPPEPKGIADPAELVDPETSKTVSKLKGRQSGRPSGKHLVTSMGCVNCHTIAPGGKDLASVTQPLTLAAIRKQAGKGCTSEKPNRATKQADYRFTAEERTAINAFLKDGLDGAGSPSPIHAARTSIKRFNCLNCHNRDGEGGIDLGRRGQDEAEREGRERGRRAAAAAHRRRPQDAHQLDERRAARRPAAPGRG